MALSKTKRNLALGLAFLAPNILGFLAFITVPLVISLYMAFTNWNLTLHNIFKPDAPIQFVGLANFIRLLSEDDFGRFLGNTLFFMMGIPFSIAGSLILAVLLNKDMRGNSRNVYLSMFFSGLLVTATIMLILSGAGATAMTMLMAGILGVLLIGGIGGGSVVYRTFFFLPSFVAGVPVYILWKKLYAPNSGPINMALREPLGKLAGPIAHMGPLGSEIGMWILLALAVIVFAMGLSRLSRLRREGDMGWAATLLGAAFVSLPMLIGAGWLPATPDGQAQIVTLDGANALEFSDTTTDDGQPSVFEATFGPEHPLTAAINEVLSAPTDIKEQYDQVIYDKADEYIASIKADRVAEGTFDKMTAQEWDDFAAESREKWIRQNGRQVYSDMAEQRRDSLARTFNMSYELRRTSASSKPLPAQTRGYLILDPPNFETQVEALQGPYQIALPDMKANAYARSAEGWITMDPERVSQMRFTLRPALAREIDTGETYDLDDRTIDRVRLRFEVAAGSDTSATAAVAAGDESATPANRGEREAYAIRNLTISMAGQETPLLAMNFAQDAANPFSKIVYSHNARTVLLIVAGVVLLLFVFRSFSKPELPCKAGVATGNAMMFGAALMVLEFVLIGVACLSLRMWEYSLDSFVPPEWLQHYDWAKPAIMLMGFWAAIGSNNMLLYLAGISNVPQDLYEAADIDGASRLQKFWSVTWPQLAPTTFFIVVMSVIGGLQGGFEMARTMTSGGPAGSTTTLSYFIYNEAFTTGRLGFSSAVAWALFCLVFTVTMINWKFGNRYVND